VRMLPFPHEDFDPAALNLYHKEVRGAVNDAKKPFTDESLPVTKAVVVAGHIHTSQRVRNTFFPGTLYQTNFGEKLPKYFAHIRFNSVKDYDIELIPHKPDYTLHRVVLESRADLKNIPRGERELVRLVIQDGCNVHASDYSKFLNVVDIKNFKSREDLQTILTEDLAQAAAIKFRTQDFWEAWLDAQNMGDQERTDLCAVRKRVLEQVRV
jgi:hypothetical protein